MRDRLLWFIIYFISSAVFAQNLTIDSLQVALRNEANQQKQSDILHELASQSWDYDFEKGFDYAEQAFKIAKASNYIQGQAQALTDKGLYYYFIGDYKNALANYLASYQVTKGKIYKKYPVYSLLSI